jgi:hypothetical protein
MSETQKNTGGMEMGTTWQNEYIAFFSTGVKPKTREDQETKRLDEWDATKKGKNISMGRYNLSQWQRQ